MSDKLIRKPVNSCELNGQPEIGVAGFGTENVRGHASRTVSSALLFAGTRELVIKHANENYFLRITNQGKLILTK